MLRQPSLANTHHWQPYSPTSSPNQLLINMSSYGNQRQPQLAQQQATVMQPPIGQDILSMSDTTLVKDLKVGTRNLSVYIIVLEVNPRTSVSKEGVEIRSYKVADRSACINFTLMGCADIAPHIQPGDICKITKCYLSSYKGAPTLYMAKGGTLHKFGEFCMVFNESLNMSESAVAAAASSASAQQQAPTANQSASSVTVIE